MSLWAPLCEPFQGIFRITPHHISYFLLKYLIQTESAKNIKLKSPTRGNSMLPFVGKGEKFLFNQKLCQEYQQLHAKRFCVIKHSQSVIFHAHNLYMESGHPNPISFRYCCACSFRSHCCSRINRLPLVTGRSSSGAEQIW